MEKEERSGSEPQSKKRKGFYQAFLSTNKSSSSGMQMQGEDEDEGGVAERVNTALKHMVAHQDVDNGMERDIPLFSLKESLELLYPVTKKSDSGGVLGSLEASLSFNSCVLDYSRNLMLWNTSLERFALPKESDPASEQEKPKEKQETVSMSIRPELAKAIKCLMSLCNELFHCIDIRLKSHYQLAEVTIKTLDDLRQKVNMWASYVHIESGNEYAASSTSTSKPEGQGQDFISLFPKSVIEVRTQKPSMSTIDSIRTNSATCAMLETTENIILHSADTEFLPFLQNLFAVEYREEIKTAHSNAMRYIVERYLGDQDKPDEADDLHKFVINGKWMSHTGELIPVKCTVGVRAPVSGFGYIVITERSRSLDLYL